MLHSLLGNLRRESSVSATSEASTSDGESSLSLGEYRNDPEIREKFKKLQSARQRLEQLQGLVAMVQQWPDSADVIPEDLAELTAEALEETASEVSAATLTSQVC